MQLRDPELRVLREEFDDLKTERSVLDDVLNDIDYFFMPNNGHMFFAEDESRYNELAQRWRDVSSLERSRYLDTGVQSADGLASTVHSTLLSPSIRWFEMSIPPSVKRHNLSVEERDMIARYMMDVNQTMFENIQMSNFSSEAASLLHGVIVHGTAVLLTEETRDDPYGSHGPAINFRSVPLNEFYFTEDFDGGLCRSYRRQFKTLAQLVDKFGVDQLPEELQKKWNQPGDSENRTSKDKYELVHVVYPRYDRKRAGTMKPSWRTTAAMNRPWGGGYFIVDAKEQHPMEELIEKEYYYECPYHLARWMKRTGSKWGYSPAHKTLDTMLTLNTSVELTLHAGASAIQPPLKALRRGVAHPINFSPGGVTVVDDDKALSPLHVTGDINIGVEFWDRFKMEVEKNFFIDKLSLKESPEMTATEVQARWRMLNRFIGPALTRLQDDFLTPLLHRVHMILYRKGVVPDVPYTEMLGYWSPPVYKGPIARAQRSEDSEAQDALLGTVATMIQSGSPEVGFAIKPWGFIKKKAESLELDWTDFLKDEEEANAAMMQAQMAQQQAMAAQQNNQNAQAAEHMAKAQGQV